MKEKQKKEQKNQIKYLDADSRNSMYQLEIHFCPRVTVQTHAFIDKAAKKAFKYDSESFYVQTEPNLIDVNVLHVKSNTVAPIQGLTLIKIWPELLFLLCIFIKKVKVSISRKQKNRNSEIFGQMLRAFIHKRKHFEIRK